MRLQFFMTPEEFARFFAEVAPVLDASAYAIAGADAFRLSAEQCPESFADLRRRHFVGFGDPTPSEEMPRPRTSFAPAALGWIQLTAPRLSSDQTLLLAEISTKWKWYDPETGTEKENAEAKRSFGRLRRKLRAMLNFGSVFVVSRASGARREVKGIGWTEAARAWLRDGGELAQEGVRNTKYEIDVAE